MFRPISYSSLILTLLLAACGGIRFLPYGEESPAGTITETAPALVTPIPASATPDLETPIPAPAILVPETQIPASDTPVLENLVPASETPGETEGAGLQSVVTASPPAALAVPTEVAATSEPAPLALEERRPYRLQPGSPAWLPNFIHPEAGCNWLGVAGQVFNTAGNPVTALVVEVGGVLRGNQVQSLSLTGVAPAYGPGGYEIYLGDRAIDSSSTLWLELKDLSGKLLTDRVSFDTFSDCGRNLVLINFVESTFEIEVTEYFFPVFYNGFSGSAETPTP